MIHFLILMPFSRPQNVRLIKEAFAESMKGAKCRVSLYAICHTEEHAEMWETNLVMRPPGDWDPCYWKCNRAIESLLPHADGQEEYFGFLCDDDTYDPGLFEAMSNHIAPYSLVNPRPEVIIISGRGWSNGETVTVASEACPREMKIGRVGLRQYFIRADVMQHFRFPNWASADGDIVEKMWQKNKNGFLFLPHLWGNWNKLPK